MSLTLYFLRQGETTHSQSDRFCGALEPDLTEMRWRKPLQRPMQISPGRRFLSAQCGEKLPQALRDRPGT